MALVVHSTGLLHRAPPVLSAYAGQHLSVGTLECVLNLLPVKNTPNVLLFSLIWVCLRLGLIWVDHHFPNNNWLGIFWGYPLVI